MTALEDLSSLLVSLPNYSLLTDEMKNLALSGALVPDADLVWPSETGYVATYDIYFAAVGLVGFLKAQPVVRQSSSEGTNVAVDAPDWGGLVAWYKSMSPIFRASAGGGVLVPVQIPYGPHIDRVDMSGEVAPDDNVDTDLD